VFHVTVFYFPVFWDCEHTETDIWTAVDSHSLLHVVMMRSEGYKLLTVLLEEAEVSKICYIRIKDLNEASYMFFHFLNVSFIN
jgi:hypothetical protein